MTVAPPRPPYPHPPQRPLTVWDVPAGLALPPAPPRPRSGTPAALIALAVVGAVALSVFGAWGVLAVVGTAGSTAGDRTTGVSSGSTPYDTAVADVEGLRGQTLTVGNLRLTPQKLRKLEYLTMSPTKCSTVTYTNVGSGSMWIGPADWTLRDPSGAGLSPTYAASSLSSGYLDTGSSVTGDVCFGTDAPLSGWDLVFAPTHHSSEPGATFHG